MTEKPAVNQASFVPATAKEVWEILNRLGTEQHETQISFAIAGALFLTGLKAGFYTGKTSGIDRYILFFKFVESIDPKLRFDKTYLNLCRRFVNYCDTKLVREDGISPNESAREPVRAVMDGLRGVASAPEGQQARVMRSLLRVRDASHLFVTFSYEWSQRFSDIEEILQTKFGQNRASASPSPASSQPQY